MEIDGGSLPIEESFASIPPVSQAGYWSGEVGDWIWTRRVGRVESRELSNLMCIMSIKSKYGSVANDCMPLCIHFHLAIRFYILHFSLPSTFSTFSTCNVLRFPSCPLRFGTASTHSLSRGADGEQKTYLEHQLLWHSKGATGRCTVSSAGFLVQELQKAAKEIQSLAVIPGKRWYFLDKHMMKIYQEFMIRKCWKVSFKTISSKLYRLWIQSHIGKDGQKSNNSDKSNKSNSPILGNMDQNPTN